MTPDCRAAVNDCAADVVVALLFAYLLLPVAAAVAVIGTVGVARAVADRVRRKVL